MEELSWTSGADRLAERTLVVYGNLCISFFIIYIWMDTDECGVVCCVFFLFSRFSKLPLFFLSFITLLINSLVLQRLLVFSSCFLSMVPESCLSLSLSPFKCAGRSGRAGIGCQNGAIAAVIDPFLTGVASHFLSLPSFF